MKIAPKPLIQRRTCHTLKAAVLGFAVLTTGIMITGCRSNEKNSNTGIIEHPAIAIIDKTMDEKADAMYGTEKATRIKAVLALKNYTNALVEIAESAEHKDSRMAAIKVLFDSSNYEALAGVMKKTVCWDVRKKIADTFARMLMDDSGHEFEEKINEEKLNEKGAEFLAMVTSFSTSDVIRRELQVEMKKEGMKQPEILDKYNTYLAIYSTNRKMRFGIMRGFRMSGDAQALKKIAEESEYPDTRKMANKALENVDPTIIPQPAIGNEIFDIGRFSQCKDSGSKSDEYMADDEAPKKTRFKDKVKRKARKIWNAIAH